MFLLFFENNINNEDQNIKTGMYPIILSKIKIATCPTFYEDIKKLDQEKFELIFTNSSTESLDLLANANVDIVLSGRILMPEEQYFDYEIIDNAKNYYSFLSNNSKHIYTDDFDSYSFFTDLELEKIKKDLSIKNIYKVDNVYDYLNDGVVITSWDNTDFTKSYIVHVLNSDTSRLKISRIPILYYKSDFELQIILEVKNILKNL